MYQEFSRLNRSRFRAYPRKTPERTDDRIDRAIDRTTDRTTDGASRRVVDRDPSVATSVRRDVRSGCSDASRSTPPRTISRSFSVAAWLARTVSPDPWVWIFEPRERVRRPKNEARRNRPKATRATAVRRGEATTIDRSIPPAREREPRKNATRFHPLRFISNHHRPRRVSLFQPRRSFRSLPSARSTRVRIGTPSLVARSSSSSRAFLVVVAFVVVVVVASSILVVARTWARVFIVVWVRRSRRDVPFDRPGGARPAKRVATNPRPGFLGVGGGGCVYRF